jgi:transposase InsO family protein
VKWTYFYLYVILDVFSRYVTGWMVAMRESAELAKRLIAESCQKQRIQPGQLTLHADRGTSMSSKPVAFLLADLGVTKTHSRPHVSNDNPYSESQFRTLKYRPEFPDRFGCIQDSRASFPNPQSPAENCRAFNVSSSVFREGFPNPSMHHRRHSLFGFARLRCARGSLPTNAASVYT